MVDFNQESTVTNSPGDIVRIIILEKRYNLMEAIEAYRKRVFRNIEASDYELRARLANLFDEIRAMLFRDMKAGDFAELEKDVFSSDFEQVMRGFYKINEWLDRKRLTMIDTRKTYDSRNVETENKAKKL